jgi:hypothetical protein
MCERLEAVLRTQNIQVCARDGSGVTRWVPAHIGGYVRIADGNSITLCDRLKGRA